MTKSSKTRKSLGSKTRMKMRKYQREWDRRVLECNTARSQARKAWTTLLLAGRDDSESRRIIEESCPAAFRTEEWGDPNETDEE